MNYQIDQEYKWSDASLLRNQLTNIYEPLQPYIFKALIEQFKAHIFLDIGANIGYYSIIFSSIDCIEEIHCFEPLVAPFTEIVKNISLNALDGRIKAHNVGLSSQSGSAQMGVLEELSGANAILSTSFNDEVISSPEATIEIRKLDEIIQSQGRRIALKIDVEGHEEEVIKGSRSIIENNECIIQIEAYQHSSATVSVLRTLENLGYRKIFRAGPDVYLSNDKEFIKTSLGVVEDAIELYIEHSIIPIRKSANSPIRLHMIKGVYIEFTPRLSRLVRKSVRRLNSFVIHKKRD